MPTRSRIAAVSSSSIGGVAPSGGDVEQLRRLHVPVGSLPLQLVGARSEHVVELGLRDVDHVGVADPRDTRVPHKV